MTLKFTTMSTKAKTKEERQTLRSKTFPGIAKAMAEHYSEYLIKKL